MQTYLSRMLATTCLFLIVSNAYANKDKSDEENSVPYGMIDELVVYPHLPNEAFKSNRYLVEVRQGSRVESSYVYMDENNFPSSKNSRSSMTDFNHWSSFSFNGSVQVIVTVLGKSLINTARIRPKSYNINTSVSSNTVTFTLTKAANVYLEIDGEEEHPIFIFANPMEEDIPLVSGSNVIVLEPGVHDIAQMVNNNFSNKTFFFRPGIHDIGETLNLDEGTIVYISGGAYVKGLLKGEVNADHIKVRGRGILSGIEYNWAPSWSSHMIELPGSAQQTDITIEGITITNSPKSSLIARGKTLVDNVKMLLFERNSDGMTIGANSIVKNSFFKVNDDVIKLFYNNIKIHRNVVWHQPVGAIFQMSWNLSRDISNIEIYDIDVIHFDRDAGTITNFLNQSFLSCRNLNGSNYSNINIHDIRLEHKPYQLLGLMFQDDKLAGFMNGIGSIDGIRFSNIEMENPPRVKSHIVTNGTQTGTVSNISFCNIKVSGNALSTIDELIDFNISGYDSNKTSNISLTSSDIANASSDKNLDCTITSIDLEATNAGTGFTYQWTTADGNIMSGANSRISTVNAAGTYTLTVTDSSGNCSDSDTVSVTSDVFTADAGEDRTLTEDVANIVLRGNPSSSDYSYNWTTEDGNIVSGENESLIVVNSAGMYELSVTSATGCISSDYVQVISTTSEDDKTISLYPNPVSDGILNIINNTGHNIATGIYDLKGSMVKSLNIAQERVAIEVDNLTPGVYIIFFLDEKGKKTKSKFIVE